MRLSVLVSIALLAACKAGQSPKPNPPIDCEPTRQKMIAEQKAAIEVMKHPPKPDVGNPFEYAERFNREDGKLADAEWRLRDLERKREAEAKPLTEEQRQAAFCRNQIAAELKMVEAVRAQAGADK